MEERHKIVKHNEINDIYLKENKKDLIKQTIALGLNAICLATGIALKDVPAILVGGVWGAISVSNIAKVLKEKARLEANINEENGRKI